MVYGKNKWEIYGRWRTIKKDPSDPHKLIITLDRNKPMRTEFVDKINDAYSGRNVTLWVEVQTNYDEMREFIASEVKKKKQGQLF